MTKLTKEQQTKRIIDQEILANQTALVDHLLGGYDESNEFDIEDIQNYYDISKDTLKEWLDYSASDKEIDEWLYDRELTRHDLYNNLEEITKDFGFESEPQEIYQWYLVSDWLKDQLIRIGEPVLVNDYGNWWGRTCCGQSIECDGTIQTIVDNLMGRD